MNKIEQAIVDASLAFNRKCPELESDYMWLAYSSFVIPKYKVVYFSVPKNACTTLKRLVYRINGKIPPSNLGDIHFHSLHLHLAQLKPGEIYNAIASSQWFRFGVVRNPYDRLLSAYKSKITDINHEPTFLKIRGKILDYYGLTGHGHKVTFPQFVKWVHQVRHMDSHWNIQAKILRVDVVKYSLLARFENFDKDMEKFFAGTKIAPLPLEITNPTNPTKMSEFYTQELADIVYEIYQKDFEQFGYHRDSWKDGGAT